MVLVIIPMQTMKKIFFTLSLLAGVTAAQAQIVPEDGEVQNETSAPIEASTPEEAVEAAYDDLYEKLHEAYKSSEAAVFVYNALKDAAKELKKAILQSYVLIEETPVWEPDPELEKKKIELQKKEQEYNGQKSEIEWFEAAEANFVKIVEDCLNTPRHKVTELQKKRAKEAAGYLSDKYKDLKDKMSKYQ